MTVGPRTRAALQAVGYGETDAGYVQISIGNEWFVFNLGSKERNWKKALDHLKANAEALCSRMMAAIAAKTAGNLEIQPGGGSKSYAVVIRPGRTSIGDGPTIHGAVLALFLRVCCDEEEDA